jgi:iron complex transport system substrate-binding protein
MSDDSNTTKAPTRRDSRERERAGSRRGSERRERTRREYVKYGGAVIGGGLLAGCAGQSGDGDTPEATSTVTATSAAADTQTETDSTETTGDKSYSATMPPVGTVEFDEPPEEVIPALQFGIDTMLALGQIDRVEMMSWKGTLTPGILNMVPGVSINPDSIEDLGSHEKDKEAFYEADPDLFAEDPNHDMTYAEGLDEKDLEEIIENVAPFFGNHSRGERGESWSNWPDGPYEYVGMYDQLDEYAKLFGVEDRARALRTLHDEMIETVQEDIPPEADRPSVALVWAGSPYNNGEFYIYNPRPGIPEVTGMKQYQDLKVNDAFDGQGYLTTDAEGLLETDPDVIFLHFGITFITDPASALFGENEDTKGKNIIEYTKERYLNDPVLSELTAVTNDRLHVGHTDQQGPVTNLFQTEMLAKQLYPDIYGEFPGLNDDGTYELPEDEQLFDRQRVADIINGDI